MPSFISTKLKKQQFEPDWLGTIVNPFYLMRRGLYESIRSLAPRLSGSLIDIGCGEKPYQKHFTRVSRYAGLEFDSPEMRQKSKADFFYDGRRFPFGDASFDSALATEVLEHIFDPEEFLEEVRRVLKPGGQLLLTCPFAWDEHSQPWDYARYSSFGVKALLERHGFAIVEQRKTNADIRALVQLRNCYVHKIIPFKSYKLRLLSYIILIAPATLTGIIFRRILPANDDLYLSNVILAKKI